MPRARPSPAISVDVQGLAPEEGPAAAADAHQAINNACTPPHKHQHHFSPKHLIEKLAKKEPANCTKEHHFLSRVFSSTSSSPQLQTEQDQSPGISREPSTTGSPSPSPKAALRLLSPKAHFLRALSGDGVSRNTSSVGTLSRAPSSDGAAAEIDSPSHRNAGRRPASASSPKHANDELYASLFDPNKYTCWATLQWFKAFRFHSCYVGLTKQYCVLFDERKQFVGIFDLTRAALAKSKPMELTLHDGALHEVLMFRFDSDEEAAQWHALFTASINYLDDIRSGTVQDV